MGAYIKITLSDDNRCAISAGLWRILCFIGNPNGAVNANTFDRLTFEKGVAIINHKMHGTCKTAIRSMTRAKRIETSSCYKYVWKLHRRKLPKALRTIRDELNRLQTPQETIILFENIYRYLQLVFKGDVKHTITEVLARAYIRDLCNKLYDPAYEKDRNIDKIVDSFNVFKVKGF